MQLLKMLSDYEHDFCSSGEMFKADMGGAHLRSESECRLKSLGAGYESNHHPICHSDIYRKKKSV